MAYTIKSWTDGNRVYAVDINKWEKGIDDAHNEKLDKTSYTATDVLTKVKTVDGAESGLDADLLDGQQGTYYASTTALADGLAPKLNSSAYTATDVRTKLLTVDGSGSGIDADLLDGLHASSFASSTHSHAWSTVTSKPSTFPPSSHNHVWADITGTLPAYATRWPSWSEVSGKPDNQFPNTAQVIGAYQNLNNYTGPGFYYQDSDANASNGINYPIAQAGTLIVTKDAGTTQMYYHYSGVGIYYRTLYQSTWSPWRTIYHSGNLPTQATRWPSWGEVSGKPTTFTPSAHNQAWSTITSKPATATRWPSWAEVSGKPTLIQHGTSVPSTLAYNTIFVKV